jgi:5-methylcytosine-specific restriction endonuclease McrA
MDPPPTTDTARVAELDRAVRELHEALRESTRLLNRCRPSRPTIPHDRKLLTAARQQWKCANPYGSCLLHRLGDGTFDEHGLFEVDHVEPYASSFRNDRFNLQALCPACHSSKSRRERLQQLEEDEA